MSSRVHSTILGGIRIIKSNDDQMSSNIIQMNMIQSNYNLRVLPAAREEMRDLRSQRSSQWTRVGRVLPSATRSILDDRTVGLVNADSTSLSCRGKIGCLRVFQKSIAFGNPVDWCTRSHLYLHPRALSLSHYLLSVSLNNRQ
jgi:hypothetical protein